MQHDEKVAAAMMAVAVFEVTKRSADTEPEAEMRRFYKRFVTFIRRVDAGGEAKPAQPEDA